MTYVYAYDHRHDLALPEIKALVGSKAANIGTMATELGLPVPPAFTVTTTACNAFLAGGWPEGLGAEIRDGMARLERLVGRQFGDPADPLLVSVRSGAPLSMPGMMDTILNLGLNDATEAGLAAISGDPAFAADCHARFVKVYRDIVGVATVPDDPWEQLRGAVEAVFRLVEQRPGPRVPRARGDQRRARHRRHRAGHGVRQPGRRLRHRRALHPQSRDRRERPLRRHHVQGAGRGGRRRHARDPADRHPRDAHARRACRAAEPRSEARAPLRRPLRHRVHHRAAAPLDAPGPGRQAERAGGPPDRRRDGRGR